MAAPCRVFRIPQQGLALMIISASRRTDIPAFYAEWMLHRLSQQQAQAVGEGKEGAKVAKGCCEATPPLAHRDPEDSPVRSRGLRLGTNDSSQSDGRGWADDGVLRDHREA